MKLKVTMPVLMITVLGVGVWSGISTRVHAARNAAAKLPTSVEVALVTRGDIALRIDATGYLSPVQSVDVRPQVNGVVSQVLVTEGQGVTAGTPLFQLEDAAERAALAKADAQRLRDEAQLGEAERSLKRALPLKGKHFLSPGDLDALESNVATLKASVAADRAAVTAAQVDLGYKRVYAAITGRIGNINVFPGSVVQPSMATPMVNLVQLDPILASFTVSEADLATVEKARRVGKLRVAAEVPANPAQKVEGELSFIDNSVDRQTGTITLKARFANPGGQLWPGSYVRVGIDAGVASDVLSIPVAALQTGPENRFVFVVSQESTVGAVPVTVQGIRDGRALVSGLSEGMRVVTVGGQDLRSGDTVRVTDPAPATAKDASS